MTNSNEHEEHRQQASTVTEPESQSQKTRRQPVPIVLACTALILAGLGFFNSTQTNQKDDKKNSELQTTISDLQKKQQNLEQQLNDQKETAEKKNTAYDKQFVELNQANSQHTNTNQDWLLLKARYYIELAQINAHWSLEDRSTLSLLEQADLILAQLNTQELFQIRQVLAKEILQLKAVTQVDIPGLLSQLDAVQNNVAQLTPQAMPNLNNNEPETKQEVRSKPGWKGQLESSFHLLGKLIIVRRDDEAIKPILSQQLEALLKESIRLSIQEAQWAVLNKNTAAYQLALKQALDALKNNFNTQNSNTSTLIAQITKLQDQDLSSKQPEVGAALPLLNQLIAQKQLQQPVNNVTEPMEQKP